MGFDLSVNKNREEMAAAAGEIQELVHYTKHPIKEFTNRPTNAQTIITIRTGKPSGFWYSYYGTWKTEFNRLAEKIYEYIIGVPAYKFTEDITAASHHSILRLTAENIAGFLQMNHDDSFVESRCPGLVYPCSGAYRYEWMNFWKVIAAHWGGVEFTESLRIADKRIPVHHGKYGTITVDISKMIDTLDIFPSGVLFHPALFQGDKPLEPTVYTHNTFFKHVSPSVRRVTAKKASPTPVTAKKASPTRVTAKNTTAKKNGKATTAALISSLLKKK